MSYNNTGSVCDLVLTKLQLAICCLVVLASSFYGCGGQGAGSGLTADGASGGQQISPIDLSQSHRHVSVTLGVKSRSLDGSAINGLWTVISSSGQTLSTGFTPVSFNASAGSAYVVTVSDYQNYVFDHWADGSTSRSITVTPSQNTTLYAYYSTSSSPQAPPPASQTAVVLTVDSLSLSGSAISGLWTVISSGGQTLSTGFTPLTFNALAGTSYTVTVSDYQNYVFDHWADGSTSSSITITPSQDVTLDAYYSTSSPAPAPAPAPVPAVCSDGQTQCASNNTAVQVCQGGQWGSPSICQYGCSSGSCQAAPPPVPAAVTLSIDSLSLSGSAISGLWTVITSGGQTLSTGFTPVTFNGVAGSSYTVTVSDYQNYVFDHWADGSTSSSITITPTQNVVLDAYYNTAAPAPAPTPAPSPSPSSGKTGVMVPLYIYPGAAWNPVIQAKIAHPNVPIIAIVNPNNGPGSGADSNYASWINSLKSAGVIVLGYIHTSYGSRTIGDCESDINMWKSWYGNIDGIFFDEMSNVSGYENYYSSMNSYVKSLGMSYTVGNPGTDTRASFVGTMDNIVIYENSGMPSSTAMTGWHTSYNKSNFTVLAYGVGSLNTSAVVADSQYVSYLYVTNDVLPNPWDTLPSYFGSMVAALDY